MAEVKKKEQQPTFEEALAELENRVKKLEADDLTLEGAMKTYQSGLELVKYCNEAIDKIQQELTVINKGSVNE